MTHRQSELGVLREPLPWLLAAGFGLFSAYSSIHSLGMAQMSGRLAAAAAAVPASAAAAAASASAAPGAAPSVGTGLAAAFVAMRLVEIAAYVALALLGARGLRGLARSRALVLAALGVCLLAGLGEVAHVLLGAPWTRWARDALSIIGYGAAPAALWLAWIELYASFDSRHVLVAYLAAQAVSACAVLGASALPLGGMVALGAASLVASVALLLLAQARADAARAAERLDVGAALPTAAPPGGPAPGPDALPGLTSAPAARRGRARRPDGLSSSTPAPAWTFPAAPVALMAVFTFANVFARDLLPAADRGYANVGVLISVAALLVAVAACRGRFKVWSLFAAALPLTLFGLFGLMGSAGALGIFSTMCTHAGDALFAVFIAVALCNISYRWDVSALMLFGFARAAGVAAGYLGGRAAMASGAWGQDALVLVLAALGVGLAVCYIALTGLPGGERTWGVPASEAEADGPAGLGAGAGDPAARVRAACARLAYDYGLTRREEQVLGLIARGYTAAQIEEELTITNSTVKTHTNAVFRKLGVHNRAEAAEMVAAAPTA